MTTNIDDLYPSKYLKAADLQGRALLVTIDRLAIEEVGQEKDQKPVLYLVGKQKAIVLNKTNSLAIANGHGRDYSQWRGKQVEIYPDRVAFQGEMKDCLRVRVPVAPALPEDDINF